MVYSAITFLITVGLILIVGLIKPKWVLFWMKEPDRFVVVAICTVLFMLAMTMYGEGLKRKQMAEATVTMKAQSATQSAPESVPVPDVPR